MGDTAKFSASSSARKNETFEFFSSRFAFLGAGNVVVLVPPESTSRPPLGPEMVRR